MKNLDDHEDGRDDAAFERALGGGRKRARKPALDCESRALAQRTAEHPGFVANICGTLIAHPAHDGVTRTFAACPRCAEQKAVR